MWRISIAQWLNSKGFKGQAAWSQSSALQYGISVTFSKVINFLCTLAIEM